MDLCINSKSKDPPGQILGNLFDMIEFSIPGGGKNMAPGQNILQKNSTPGETFLPNFSNCDFSLVRKILQTALKNISKS